MVRVSIREDAAIFDVQGLHKLWAFKSRLKIPLDHIKQVRVDPNIATTVWKGIRMPGIHVPRVLAAGTFYKDDKRFFWDVRNRQNTIVVELADERYQELIIEVDDPAAEVARLQAATFQGEVSVGRATV